MTHREYELIEKIEEMMPLDAIVVEGYDGVGKGRILEVLSEHLGVKPYRPDYNLWQQFDHRKEDRWKISGFFWDVFSHFHDSSGSGALLFDRGVLSGAVYNRDMNIAKHYKEMLRDMKVLHILVECSEEDYIRYHLLRNPENNLEDLQKEYNKYLYFTALYHKAIEVSGVDYIVYENQYDINLATDRAKKCKGCGHYAHGWCRHPAINHQVDAENKRCVLSKDKEVQDIDSEMHVVQS